MRRVWLVFVLVVGCGGWEEPGDDGLPLPAWMQSTCGRDLTAVEGRLRVSGHETPCPLLIDLEGGRVHGDCPQVTTGIDRVVALEFFVRFEGEELVLSQQLGKAALTDLPEAANRVSVTVASEVTTRDCLQRLSPPDRDLRVCDEDGDSLTNLDEYCSQDRDPLRVERIGDP